VKGDATTIDGAGTASGRGLYGLAAEYATPEAVLSATEAARAAGFRTMDAYAPFAVEGLDQALGQPPSRLGYLVLAVALLGIGLGYGMQYFASVEYYPLNVGGRPLNSWPNFIVITFEVTVLLAALTTAVVMLLRNGLPQPYHSIFNAPGFERASRDRFFLCIEAADPRFDLVETRAFLEGTGALAVVEVER
jgi:hypothetical protein